MLSPYNLMAVVNSAAMDIGMHVSFQISGFGFVQIHAQEWKCWVVW